MSIKIKNSTNFTICFSKTFPICIISFNNKNALFFMKRSICTNRKIDALLLGHLLVEMFFKWLLHACTLLYILKALHLQMSQLKTAGRNQSSVIRVRTPRNKETAIFYRAISASRAPRCIFSARVGFNKRLNDSLRPFESGAK